MRVFYLSVLLILSYDAKGKDDFWVKIENTKISLFKMDQSLYSSDCNNCLAKKYIQKKVLLKKNEIHFKNPSSLICKKIDSSVRIGTLHNGHSQSFCEFKDGSFLSTNSFVIEIED
jgi:hypothetical protein